MAIQQTIEFKSDNKYFVGFLQELIKEYQINASVSFANHQITLLIDEDDQSKLESFSNATTKYLPNSIFLGHIQTNNVDEKVKINGFEIPAYDIAPCAKCLEAISDPASSDYLNDSYVCKHYSNATTQKQDFTHFSVHYSEGMSLLLCDVNKANEFFYLSELELKTLFSIEKPSIKVTIKDERIKEITGKNFIYIRAPYSVKSALTALNAKESEIEYLFFDPNDNKECVIVKDNISFVRDNTLTKELESLHEDVTFNRILNIEKEVKFKGSISANMSKNNGISFIVSNEVGISKVVKFQEFSNEKFLIDMQNDELKSKMFANFESKYPGVIEKLKTTPNATLFETLAIILELDFITFDALCDKSYEFRGNGGLKIDMYFNKDGFDFVSFFGSIMSFKLAGSDTHFLAYSIFEAFGDMIITTSNQLKTEFKIDNFIMIGDMFENSVMYSRILSKFQLSKPYFPIDIALDEKVQI